MDKVSAGNGVVLANSESASDALDELEAELVADWVRPAVGPIAVAFGPTGRVQEGAAAPQVNVALLGVTPAAAARASSRDPPSLRLLARYLVTATAPKKATADRLIVALAFAALERGLPELERDGPVADQWLSLGVEARPALVVRAVLERHRPVHVVPLVRQPVVTQWSHTRSISGLTLGPGGVPIAGARIEVASTGLTTFSDHRGAFVLLGVPVGPPAPMLLVTAKGVGLTVRATSPASEPLVISLPLPES
jgi:hypothetical protein